METKIMKTKKYSFDLIVPKDFKNAFIVVDASNPKSAKKKLIKETTKLNERFMQVYEFDAEKEKLIR